VAEVRRPDEFDNAFLTIASARPHALAVLADRFLLAHRKRILEFAAANRLPSMYPYRGYVDAGGLISYAPNNIELFRGAATYVDKILKGAKPNDLPDQEPTKFRVARQPQDCPSARPRHPADDGGRHGRDVGIGLTLGSGVAAAQAHFRKTIMAKEKKPTEQERFAQTHPEGVFHP
jgi:hypothetical protein